MSCRPLEVHDNRSENVDSFEAALLQLKEAVAENSRMLDALIRRLGVPYEKPSPGQTSNEQ